MLNILANVVRGTGNMTLPAQVLVCSVLGHALLSPLLIFGWGPVPALGPAGAGWGLVITFAVGGLVLFAYLQSARALVRLPPGWNPMRWHKAGLVRYEWALFKDILSVGIPGMANVAINNLSVILLTGIAAHLGQEAALGYAIGARLEYIIIPLAFGFGTALVAMIGTNWGARQFARARRIAWTGTLTVAAFCGAVGVFRAVSRALDRLVQRARRNCAHRHALSADRRAGLHGMRRRHGLVLLHAGRRQFGSGSLCQRPASCRQHLRCLGGDQVVGRWRDRHVHRYRRGLCGLRHARGVADAAHARPRHRNAECGVSHACLHHLTSKQRQQARGGGITDGVDCPHADRCSGIRHGHLAQCRSHWCRA